MMRLVRRWTSSATKVDAGDAGDAGGAAGDADGAGDADLVAPTGVLAPLRGAGGPSRGSYMLQWRAT